MTTDYLSIDRMSQSKLKMCWEDPALFQQVYVLKCRPQPESTPSMQFGTDCERYLFEGGFSDVREIPESALNADGHRKGKAWTDWCGQWEDGTRMMKRQEYRAFIEPFKSIKENIDNCQPIANLIYGGERKVQILWSYLGVEMKSEIDILHSHCIVDLKTCADVSPEGFASAVANYGYNVQAAAYQLAVQERRGGELLPFVFVAAANKPSYRVEFYSLSEKFLASGRELLQEMILFYQQCKNDDEWKSGTWGRLIELDAPAWYDKQLEAWSV